MSSFVQKILLPIVGTQSQKLIVQAIKERNYVAPEQRFRVEDRFRVEKPIDFKK